MVPFCGLPEDFRCRLKSHKKTGAGAKLGAMVLKSGFLKTGCEPELKTGFRWLQREGGRLLGIRPICAISSFSREFLKGGIPSAWRERRAANVRRLLKRLAGWRAARPLFSSWPENSTPFAAVFMFRSRGERDQYRVFLENHNVYCPVHWPSPEQANPHVRDPSALLLTIPADQRYSLKDIDRIVEILLSRKVL